MHGRSISDKTSSTWLVAAAAVCCSIGAAFTASRLRHEERSREPSWHEERRFAVEETGRKRVGDTESVVGDVRRDGDRSPQQAGVSSNSPILGMTGFIVANSSLIVAVLVYLGWVNEDAYYGYFNLHPIDLGASVLEYLLSSADMFNPIFVILAASATAIFWAIGGSGALAETYTSAFRVTAKPLPEFIRHRINHLEKPQSLQVVIGFGATATAVALVMVDHRFSVSIYVLLALFASGPLLMARARDARRTRPTYIFAIFVAGGSLIWAGSIYAHSVGMSAARTFASKLSGQTAAAVYTAAPIALSDRAWKSRNSRLPISSLGTGTQVYEF